MQYGVCLGTPGYRARVGWETCGGCKVVKITQQQWTHPTVERDYLHSPHICQVAQVRKDHNTEKNASDHCTMTVCVCVCVCPQINTVWIICGECWGSVGPEH